MPELPGLRLRRERLGLTQADLAERARVSRLTIGRLEQGRTSAHLTTARKLADVLETTVDHLARRPAVRRGRGAAVAQPRTAPGTLASMIAPARPVGGTRVQRASQQERTSSDVVRRRRMLATVRNELRRLSPNELADYKREAAEWDVTLADQRAAE